MNYMKQHPLLVNLSVAMISAFVFLGIAELYFRHTGVYASYGEKNGGDYTSPYNCEGATWYDVFSANDSSVDETPEFRYLRLSNNEGLIEKHFDTAKPAGRVRIMVIGDSFIQGVGAPYDSSCPRQMEGIINRQMNGSLPVEVWDCGVSSSDPFFEYILLQNKLLKYKPDMVILAINGTDIYDVTTRGGYERFRPDSTAVFNKAPWFEPLYAHSYIVRRWVHDVMGYNWQLLTPEQMANAKTTSIRQIDTALGMFQALCTANRIALLVVFQPGKEELFGNASQMDPFISYCRAAHIPSIEMKPCLEEKCKTAKNTDAIFWPINQHFNSTGYGYYAQCLSVPVIEYLDSIKKAQ